MKICFVTAVFPPRISGPSTQTYHLAEHLKRTGEEVVVITFGTENSLTAKNGYKVYYMIEYQYLGVKLSQIDSRLGFLSNVFKLAGAFFRIRKILRVEKPDVIHHQTGIDYLCFISGYVAKSLKIPAVIKYAGDLVWERTMQKGDIPDNYEAVFKKSFFSRFLTLMEKWALSNFKAIWSTSGFQRSSLINILGVDPAKIVDLPNFISVDTSAGKKRVYKSEGPVEILNVCRFASWKGVDDTLRVFAGIKGDVRLRIVGGENPPLEAMLKRLAKELGIEKKVLFEGAVSPTQISRYYAKADIFISNTKYEPFGIVFVEAMSKGLPIIATHIGGIPEVVPDGKAGFLFEVQETVEMTKKLQKLVDDPKLREKIGSFGVKHSTRFDIAGNLSFLVDEVYRKMLRGRIC